MEGTAEKMSLRMDYLQLAVLRHLRPLDTTTTSGSERCGTSRYRYAEARSHQPSPSAAAALVTSSPAYEFELAVLVYKSLYGLAP